MSYSRIENTLSIIARVAEHLWSKVYADHLLFPQAKTPTEIFQSRWIAVVQPANS
jgi:hypothetical protein